MVDFLLKDYSTAASSQSDASNSIQQYYQLTDDEEYVLIEALVAVVALCMDHSAERKPKSKKKVNSTAVASCFLPVVLTRNLLLLF